MALILIQNVGELPLWGMRLLGYSDKTDLEIGKFGTGLKEAIALLIREEIYPTIYSGTCAITFSLRNDPAEIHFSLSEDRDSFTANTWYGLGISPNFGHHDWNDLWMVLREVVCNAYDAGGLFHDVVSTMDGVAGSTRFYIPASKMFGVYGTLERRLPLLEGPVDCLMEKGDQEKIQIFHKGVWVQEGQKNSLFDYNLDIKLNESRSADWYDVGIALSKAITGCNEDQARKYLTHWRGSKDGTEESSLRDSHARKTGPFADAFRGLFGEGAVLCIDDKHYADQVRQKGKRPIVFGKIAHDYLAACGVPCIESVLSSTDKEFETVREAVLPRFDAIWDRIGSGKKPDVKVFTLPSGNERLGMYTAGCCYVNESVLGSEMEDLVHIEEISHHLSGSSDYSREFQNHLIGVIKELI